MKNYLFSYESSLVSFNSFTGSYTWNNAVDAVSFQKMFGGKLKSDGENITVKIYA